MPSISRCIPHYQRRSYMNSATDLVYVAIFSYLILFNILNTMYADSALYHTTRQPDSYNIETLIINRIKCSFPISSQYQKTPRYICLLLMVFTVTIRNHRWIAAGAATSVLTYSGVAAIHALILYATNNRFHPQQAKTRCESIPIPGSNTQFVACAGVLDQDIAKIMHIISTVMLGALPMAAWSTTFRKSASKAIFMFWLLLLAVGHTFWPITMPDQNFHFQICSKDYVEPLPDAKFQALLLDDAWSKSFQSLALASQQVSPFFKNSSTPVCLYSCFASTTYIGRNSQDIIISPTDKLNPFVESKSQKRLGIIIFWWAYAFGALLTFFTTEKQNRLPGWIHKRVFSIKYRQLSWILIWKYLDKNIYNIVNTGQSKGNKIRTANSPIVAESHSIKRFQISVLQIIQFTIQLSAVAAFGGSILYIEISDAVSEAASMERGEQFTAVGQWSCVAVVLLVLFAAVVSRLWGASERNGKFGNIATKKIRRIQMSDEWYDEEWTGIEEWDWRVGYAS